MSYIKIFQVFHKDGKNIDCDYIIPIQVGKNNLSCSLIKDDTGDNISDKNESYCELTAQYWAWKNESDAEYIGLMHYRRVFDFSGTEKKRDHYGTINEKKIGLDFEAKYGYTVKNLENFIKQNDIILPKPWSVRNIGYPSLLKHYEKADHHFKEHLQVTHESLIELYPEYSIDYDAALQDHKGFFTNMFIMKKIYFQEYSLWLFTILRHVESKISLNGLSIQEKRVFGYLSERLLNVWIKYQMRQNPNLKIGTLHRVFIENTDQKSYYNYNNFTPNNSISVVIASDDNYVPHLGALIESICTFFTQKYLLDLIILDGGISGENKRLLRLQLSEKRIESKITFCDLADEFLNLNVHMHFSRATFYRLVLDKIIPQHQRVLYIDCDTIVNKDVSELFFTDLNGKSIGASFDYIMHHFCNTNARSLREIGYLPAKKYLTDYVNLKGAWENYFQAGVIVFDLDKVRAKNCGLEMMLDLSSKKYWFLDQDILNKYFQNDVYFIDPKWNYVNTGTEVFKGLSAVQIDELIAARQDPYIIHYAGYEAKPWINKNAAFAHMYFKFLRSTYWYEFVVQTFSFKTMKISFQDSREYNILYKIAKSIWVYIPYPVKYFALPLTKQIKKIIG